jgi:hypothetical protein
VGGGAYSADEGPEFKTSPFFTNNPSYSAFVDPAAIMIKIHLLEIVAAVLLVLLYLLVKIWRRI